MLKQSVGRWCSILASAALLTLGGLAVDGADAKPAKKDSRAARPKEASFTTSVVPSKAMPGDVVTFKVTAKIDAPCHIYKYAKTQPDQGPVLTSFDFFDPAGMTVEGDWKPSRDPIRKKEPSFPELEAVEFYEEEVSWTIKLQVPAKATTGKKPLRCQVGYMICSDQNCSIPGQWTLPEAVLTVVPSSTEGKLSADLLSMVLVSTLADQPPKPVKRDSKIPMPTVVALTFAATPAEAKAGETVTLTVKAKLQPGWHIFQYARSWDGDGPKPTLLDGFDLGGLEPAGDWTSTTRPIRKHDPNFKEIEALEFFEDEATWTRKMTVSAASEPGPRSLKVQAGFQVCSSSVCQVPGQWTLTPVAFNILGGGADAPARANPAPTPKAEAPPTPAPPESRTSSTAPASESPMGSEAGFLGFLLWCAGGGLLALAMPCVWPMIPITVNFFVKQGEKDKARPTRLALAYCLSIIGIFTGLGVLASVFLGAASLQNLANNPWLNTGVAILFLVFGLSLLGLFEVRLPNFLLNASAQGEGRGGLIGVMFMASTLTITSFTCTFPVVGALLVSAAGGSYFKPIIGLATFSTVLALPFFLLALSPGLLKKMPKSGDWMNTVKVVGGLIEIAAAFKFVNSAELGFNAVPESAWCDEQTMLTIWIVMALICAVYLLGLFKTDHDHAEAKVGPARLIIGAAFGFLALYMTPALFNQKPPGQIYNRLIVGLLPPKGAEIKATSSDPEIAITQQKSKHGVTWGMSYAAALAEARREKKLVLVDFTGVNCSNCRQMEQAVMPRSEVASKMGEFVTVQLFTDRVPIASITQDQREDLAVDNYKKEVVLVNTTTSPCYVVIDPSGDAEKVLGSVGGYVEPDTFIKFLESSSKKQDRPIAGPSKESTGG